MEEDLEEHEDDIWIKIFSKFLSNIKITNYFNYKPRFNGAISRNNLTRIKDGMYVINLDDKKVKKHIGFHYLLTEIQLYILILLELNIFHKKC